MKPGLKLIKSKPGLKVNELQITWIESKGSSLVVSTPFSGRKIQLSRNLKKIIFVEKASSNIPSQEIHSSHYSSLFDSFPEQAAFENCMINISKLNTNMLFHRSNIQSKDEKCL